MAENPSMFLGGKFPERLQNNAHCLQIVNWVSRVSHFHFSSEPS